MLVEQAVLSVGLGVALLRQAGVPPQPMAALLLAANRREGEAASAPSAGWTALLRTHPAAPERAPDLAAGGAAECRGH